MLSDEVIDKVVDRLVARIEEANTFVLGQIAESVNKIGTLSPNDLLKIGQIIEFGGDFDKIVQKLAKITNLNEKEIYEIFEEVAKNDYKYAKQFYDYRNVKYIPYEENVALKKQIAAIAEITAKEYRNISRTQALGFGIRDEQTKAFTFRGLKEEYQNIIDEAILSVSQGKETFDEVMYRKLKAIGESGLKVMYRNEDTGKTYAKRLDTAVRQNIKEGLTKMHEQMQEQIGEEFDSDGVEISVHLMPAPDHEKVQGRQFSKEEFKKFQEDADAVSYDGIKFPSVSEETGHDRRAIGQYNCYHYTFSIVLGVNEPSYSNEQLQKIIDDNDKGFEFEGKHYTLYEGTQVQRKIETELRKAKDEQIMAKKTNKKEWAEESQRRINLLTKTYKEFSEAGNLPTKLERARVSGYRKIKVNETYKVDKNDIIKINPSNIEERVTHIEERIRRLEDDIRVDTLFLKNRNIDENSGHSIATMNRVNKRELIKAKEELNKWKSASASTIALKDGESCKELLELVNIHLSDDVVKNVDFKILKSNTKKLYEMANEYPEITKEFYRSRLHIDIDRLNPNEVAKTNSYVTTLNSKYYKNYQKMYDSIKYTTDVGWHIPVTDENVINQTITHEFGHIVSFRLKNIELDKPHNIDNLANWDKYIYDDFMSYATKKIGLTEKELADKYISEYGKSNTSEAFAEIYASSRLGVKNKLGDALNEYIKERLK